MAFQIVPVRVGRAPDVPRADLLWGQYPGQTVQSPHVIWVVRDAAGEVTVLDLSLIHI